MPQKMAAIRIPLPSLAATGDLGRILAPLLPPGVVGLFHGVMGAGKTTLIKALCQGLGIPPAWVTSPTYTMVHVYRGSVSVHHVDFFRLEDPLSLCEMDPEDWLNPEGPTFIEWPGICLPFLEEWLPRHLRLDFRLSLPTHGLRSLGLEGDPALLAALLAALPPGTARAEP